MRMADLDLQVENETQKDVLLRDLAKRALAGGDAQLRATRCMARVLFKSLVETRNYCNALRAEVAALGGTPPPPLASRTWAQAVAAVRQMIDLETDPEAEA